MKKTEVITAWAVKRSDGSILAIRQSLKETDDICREELGDFVVPCVITIHKAKKQRNTITRSH